MTFVSESLLLKSGGKLRQYKICGIETGNYILFLDPAAGQMAECKQAVISNQNLGVLGYIMGIAKFTSLPAAKIDWATGQNTEVGQTFEFFLPVTASSDKSVRMATPIIVTAGSSGDTAETTLSNAVHSARKANGELSTMMRATVELISEEGQASLSFSLS